MGTQTPKEGITPLAQARARYEKADQERELAMADLAKLTNKSIGDKWSALKSSLCQCDDVTLNEWLNTLILDIGHLKESIRKDGEATKQLVAFNWDTLVEKMREANVTDSKSARSVSELEVLYFDNTTTGFDRKLWNKKRDPQLEMRGEKRGAKWFVATSTTS